MNTVRGESFYAKVEEREWEVGGGGGGEKGVWGG